MSLEPSHLRIGPGVELPPAILHWRFSRSSGPGGQNVNKLNSRATLTVSLDDLAAVLPAHAMRRLPALAGPYLAEGRLVIHAQAARSQRDNRQAALDHLVDLLKRSLVRPKRRKPTRPPASSRRKRIETKKQRAQVKQMRRPPQD